MIEESREECLEWDPKEFAEGVADIWRDGTLEQLERYQESQEFEKQKAAEEELEMKQIEDEWRKSESEPK